MNEFKLNKLRLLNKLYENIPEEYKVINEETKDNNFIDTAVRAGKYELVELLLEMGTYITTRAFNLAIKTKNIVIISLFINHGYKVTSGNVIEALKTKYKPISHLLISYYQDLHDRSSIYIFNTTIKMKEDLNKLLNENDLIEVK